MQRIDQQKKKRLMVIKQSLLISWLGRGRLKEQGDLAATDLNIKIPASLWHMGASLSISTHRSSDHTSAVFLSKDANRRCSVPSSHSNTLLSASPRSSSQERLPPPAQLPTTKSRGTWFCTFLPLQELQHDKL